ncbi:terminase large subunit [Bradyrhizobium ottawaense]|uniref:terminase large subunit n=1 Tax=Bradyrhizobium ottawaense TaxID=931866 RepID=UPI00271512AB|nr:terminase large subunit [Bradyrhizobium ottawaense]WLB43030.1 terminase large subunit [Bradyrhizobium ottawaense]
MVDLSTTSRPTATPNAAPPLPLDADAVDEVSAYARAVLAGEIVAGPLVRAACRRHLADLEHGAGRGLLFDVDAAQRAIGFFRDILTVEVEEKDEYGEVSTYAAPFDLQAWQAFIIGSLFGWKNSYGVRRFRRAYVEIGKGNGKSPLAAGIGHYMLLGCRKLRAEVYSAATDKDQAAILFRDAVAMWERSPALRRRLKPKGANPIWELHTSRPGVNSYFKPISSDKKGKSGIRPYCALIDEVHEHPDNSVIEMMRAGTKGNQEALLFEITNSGFDKKTVCGQEHDLSARILNGEFENDAWFAYIACLDENDDPFEDEACWPKANPNLGVSIHPPFIREQVQEARGMPSKEGLVRRLHFCQWTESESSAIPRATWMACEADVDPDALTEAGVPCFGGLDLSRTRDLTAFTLTWVLDPTKDQWKFASRTWFWTPKDTLKERAKSDRAPYELWVEQKHLEPVPGPRIKYSWLASALLELNARYHPVMIGADQYGLEQLNEALSAINGELPTEVHPQGFQRRVVGEREDQAQKETGAEDVVLWMPDSINKLEAALLEQRITVAVNPVMRMCAGGVVYEQNKSGHRMFNKAKATTRIDGMVALAMSVGIATTTKAKSEPRLVLL